jgi:hypothetical protein
VRDLIVDADDQVMELTIEQAREVARLRRQWPRGAVVLHHREHDLIVEVRRGDQTVALRRFGADGSVGAQRPIAA